MILHLHLKEKWYRMIERGEKTEEYREIKPYWIRRVIPADTLIAFSDYQMNVDIIVSSKKIHSSLTILLMFAYNSVTSMRR